MLELRGIPYEELHHAGAYTAQEVAQREHFSGHRVAKVVVMTANDRPVELVLSASRHINLDRVRHMLPRDRCAPWPQRKKWRRSSRTANSGAVPPLRHWRDVDVLVDRLLPVEGDILFQAGTHEDAVRLRFHDWYEMVKPQVATFSEPAELVHA